MDIKIIYEDEDLLVVDKPAGVVITDIYPDLDKIHRLDKDTSGVLLIAKTEESLLFYQKQFSDKSKGLEKILKKRYIALVVGSIQDNEKRIATLIGRGKNDRKKQKVYLLNEPGSLKGKRSAITDYKVVKRFKDYTLLEVFPKTGRKHQIRAHLAYINHPIVGDKVYGFKNQPCPEGLSQHFLHAECIIIEMMNGETKEFCSELPKGLKEIINKLSTPAQGGQGE
ncbi:RluA family pseudouridine synthase [Patescibacteria group bacterium]|nr:RluA family pseudouridine synthase [Patescibacteria group bacterium]